MAENPIQGKLDAVESLLKEIREAFTRPPLPPTPNLPDTPFYRLRQNIDHFTFEQCEQLQEALEKRKQVARADYERKYAKQSHLRRSFDIKCPHCNNTVFIQYFIAQGDYRCTLCGHSWPATPAEKALEQEEMRRVLQEFEAKKQEKEGGTLH